MNHHSGKLGGQKRGYPIKCLSYEVAGFVYPIFMSSTSKKFAMFEVDVAGGELVDEMSDDQRSIFRVRNFPYDKRGELYCDSEFFYSFRDAQVYTTEMITESASLVVGHIRRDKNYFPMNNDFILDLRDLDSKKPQYTALYKFIQDMTRKSKWIKIYDTIMFSKALNKKFRNGYSANTIILPDDFTPSSDNQ